MNPILKVWDGARQDRQGNPLCVRIARAVPSHLRSTPATALAVHDNKVIILDVVPFILLFLYVHTYTFCFEFQKFLVLKNLCYMIVYHSDILFLILLCI